MSLSGTLRDLPLAELLQLAALLRKSGVLEIRAPLGRVWIGFKDGAVVRVARSDGSLDRKTLLIAAGLDSGAPDATADPVLQEAAFTALVELLAWEEGAFGFDTDRDPFAAWTGPDGVELREPVSPQLVALEGTRLGDEQGDGDAPSDSAERRPAPAQALPGCAIAIDEDFAMLEQIKRALGAEGVHVHILQSSADGFARFKQYLLRGEVPALVLGAGVSDPLTPGPAGLGARALARRVQVLAPSARVVILAPPGAPPGRPPLLPVVTRPNSSDDPATIGEFLSHLRQALVAVA
jgi:hypothetical protein